MGGAQTITEFPVMTAGSQPVGITAGPDGNLWFTEFGVGKIGRITTAGTVTEFPAAGNPQLITVGSDGNLWFTEQTVYKIGRMTTAGRLHRLPDSDAGGAHRHRRRTGREPLVLRSQRRKIGRITTAGVVTEFPIPSGGTPAHIAAGPDGNLWFTNS